MAASLFTSYSHDDMMLRLGASQVGDPLDRPSQAAHQRCSKERMLGHKFGKKMGKTIETRDFQPFSDILGGFGLILV